MKLIINRYFKNFALLLFFCFLQIGFISCAKENGTLIIKREKAGKITLLISQDSTKIDLSKFHVFSVNSIESKGKFRTFISLSDLYNDSITIPPKYINDQQNIPFETRKRIELPEFYRKKLLKGTGYKESDSLFIYNFDKNKLEKFLLKDLKAVANLNVYSDENEKVADYYYQIGFELNEKFLVDVDNPFYRYSLVFIGPEKPFFEKGLSRIKWKKIPDTDFADKKKLRFKNLKLTGTYGYSDEENHYFVQDYTDNEYTKQRFLKVINKKSGVNYLRDFNNRDEGSELVNLNGITDPEYTDFQFTGKLFRNKPPVIFDFVNSSFGCPEIFFLDNTYPSLSINCDNRH